MKYYLVGCGGIGGWLANALVKMLKRTDQLFLIDGDKLEKKNLDRQLFTEKDIGQFKADALKMQLEQGARCPVTSMPEYLGHDELFEFAHGSWVLSGVDNHNARVRMLRMVDDNRCRLLSASNGFEDAEAFVYLHEWKDSPMDPRVYCPDILEDHSGDPLKPPCTGEILESTPQLAIANMSAASYAMWLLWFWREKYPALQHDASAAETAPVHVTSSAGKVRCLTIKHKKEAANAVN
jgi:molybdopterin/thiamine biosynthesis adenylyltransferase